MSTFSERAPDSIGAGSLSIRGDGCRSVDWPPELLADLVSAAGEVEAALAVAGRVAALTPATGATMRRWEVLATLAAVDLTVARVIEPHLDALAILGEAPEPVPLDRIGATGTEVRWGVWAAHSGDTRLEAVPERGRWVLRGRKPWCSLAPWLSHAVVTAHTPGGARRAFAVGLHAAGVRILDTPWVARGLTAVQSPTVEFGGSFAIPVGPDGWYLRRPGFARGGLGVAACWYGGAVALMRSLRSALASRERADELDEIGPMYLGKVDGMLHAARACLAESAELVDSGYAEGDAGILLANRVRATVAAAGEQTIRLLGHALGPAPLCHDQRHAARVADLEVYLRQHHAARDHRRSGQAILRAENRDGDDG